MRWILLLVLGFHGLFANPIEDLFPSSSEEIASLKSERAIGGYVNPFSGQLALKAEDLHVIGAQDLILSRVYLPPRIMGKYDDKATRDKYELASVLSSSRGWVTLSHLWCGINAKSPYFQVPDPSGFVLEFKCVDKKWVLATPTHGMSNLSGEEPGSSTDLRNTELQLDEYGAKVITPNGTQRIYAKVGPGVFRLEAEILPNGKAIRYEFLNHGITKVIATDLSGKHVYNFIKVLGSGRFLASDGSKTEFSYEHQEVKGSRKNKTIKISHALLRRVSNPFYLNAIGYDDRHLLNYYDGKEYPIRCKYTNKKDTPAQIEKLSFPIGAYSFSYDIPIAGEKGGSTTVIQPSGTKTIYRFDHRLLLTAIENWSNRLINQKLFHYDEKQHLTKVETKDGEGNLLISKVYECDRAGNPILETSIGDFGTFSIRREFSKNRLIREERDDGLGFDYTYLNDTRLITSKTILDHGTVIRKVIYEYDESCNLIRESIEGRTVISYILRHQSPHLHRIEWKEERDWNDQLIQKIHYDYDQWGHIAKEEIYGSDGKFAYAVERTYNGRGDLLAETNPIGQTANYEYDSRGRLIREVPFSRKLAIGREYDEKGHLVTLQEGKHTTKFEYNESDLLIQKTDYLGFATKYCYDPIHQKPIEIDSPPSLTRLVYDAFGREIARSDAYGNTQTTRYNAYGAPVEILHPSGGHELFEYFSNNSLASHTDPDGIKIAYARDVLGRITSKTVADAKTSYQRDAYDLLEETNAEGITTQFAYDKAGRKTKEIIAGRETAFTYDSLGFLAKIQTGNRITKYTRDFLGRLQEESIGGLLKTSWTYDESGNIASMTRGGTTSFVYDPYDRLLEKTDPLGFKTTISYEEGITVLVKRMTDPRGIETVETYDPHGLLLKKKIPGVQLQEFEYDKNLRRSRYDHLTFTYAPEGWLTSMTEGGKRTTKYSHTPAGRISTKQLPDGQILQYEYDSLGFLSKLGELEFNYDRVGRLTGGSGFQRTLDPFGNIQREQFSNGLWIETTYDELDRPVLQTLPDHSAIRYNYDPVFLKTVERIDPVGNLLYAHSYDEYNEVGNLIQETHRSPVRYAHDQMGRQILRSDDYLTEACCYDPVGNLLEKGGSTFSYDALSQVTSETPNRFTARYDGQYNCIEFNGKAVFLNDLNELETESYDLNGNLVRDGYVYDVHGRLTRASGQTFVYDAIGRRLSKGDTAFLYIGDQEIGSFKNGQPKELRIPGHRRAVSIEVDSVSYIPIHDVQETVRALVDWGTGEIAQQNAPDVFGQGINSELPYAYAGKRFDADTGLIYFGKRYYDLALRRWLSPDPLGAIDSSNFYQYVYNNPLRYIDPNGENICGFCLGMGEIILGGTLMLTGGVLEIASFGTLTMGVVFQEAAGIALISDGFARSMQHGRDISFDRYPKHVWTSTEFPMMMPKRSTHCDPDIRAGGFPHTVIEAPGAEGKYTTFNPDGTVKQYRGSGKPHGGIPRPNVKENKIDPSPTGPRPSKPKVREANPEEIPRSH